MDFSQDIRQQIIEQYLRIKPLNHGQVHISQIAIPDTLKACLGQDKVEAATQSIRKFGSNLYPIIVRRTNGYGEDKEYEVIFGEEWCEAAKQLELERIWVWVFDLSDDEVAYLRQFLEEGSLRSNLDESQGRVGHNRESQETGQLGQFDQILSILSQILSILSAQNQILVEIKQSLDELLDRLPKPPQLKNINGVTEEELKNSQNPIVKKHASEIYQFISARGSIKSIDELKQIRGIGPKTIEYLKNKYKCE
ncbi:MAG: ParB N-terminal domain-containing protein [Thermostichus sp. DG_1_6_bins_120]